MGWQPGPGGGAGASFGRGPGTPGGVPPARDPRLAEFASVAGRDALAPSGLLALAADEVSGPERRCPGATDDELVGLLRAWAAIESWAAGAKLGVIAEMIRRDDGPHHGDQRRGDQRHGDLPDEWSPSLRHELALALACSVQSAETSAWLAWEQQARLPGIGDLLNNGTLTAPKARAITETFKYLTDADAAGAEALILDQLAGKTFTQILRLAEQAALTVDPQLAQRRREQAQKSARVIFFREQSGTAGLSGRDLPPDEALAAMAAVNARAQEYEDSGAFGDARMDVLRAYAYVDLLKGTLAEVRLACAEAQDEAAEAAELLAWANAREARAAAQTPPGQEAESGAGPVPGPQPSAREGSGTEAGGKAGSASGDNNASEEDRAIRDIGDRERGTGDLGGSRHNGDAGDPGDPGDPGDDGDGGLGPSGPGCGGPAAGPGAPPAGRAFQPRPPDLIVPLLTLLGLAEQPGEIQGFGLLDPALARDMAAAAIASPRTGVCVTVTSPEGYAVGHGCARLERIVRSAAVASPPETSSGRLPARLNLTVPDRVLSALVGSTRPWNLTPCDSTGPPDRTARPDGYGTWTLTLPDGRRLTVRLDVVPTFQCDHRYETHAYQPSAKLRHLVQVRDGTCTFPSCNRHAKASDFEHATPYDKGGKTCTCNAGARSRACHRVKQSPGWNVAQPKPGWHQWQTPSGRVYVQEPKRYVA
jgi:hypothetical protein